jgi:hypothetical protein
MLHTLYLFVAEWIRPRSLSVRSIRADFLIAGASCEYDTDEILTPRIIVYVIIRKVLAPISRFEAVTHRAPWRYPRIPQGTPKVDRAPITRRSWWDGGWRWWWGGIPLRRITDTFSLATEP